MRHRPAWRLVAVALAIGAVPLATAAQQPAKVARVGVLSPIPWAPDSAQLGGFRQRLRELGWIEGQNLLIVARDAGGKMERLPEVAADLVRLKLDVIVTMTTPDAVAAKNGTATIPIVMAGSADPVERGLVQGLARPGGNVTGLTNNPGPDFSAKQLELLKEAAPRISRVAVLLSSTFPPTIDRFNTMQVAARTLGVTLVAIEVNTPTPFDPGVILRERADALIVFQLPQLLASQRAILDLAVKHRLPAMYGNSDWVEHGGLMSYWTNWVNLRRRAADFVAKILRGTKPADLPVEEPMRYELVVNLRTAKALGLTVPQSVIVLADRLIQ